MKRHGTAKQENERKNSGNSETRKTRNSKKHEETRIRIIELKC